MTARRLRQQDGASAVEFAIVLPLLMVLLLGAIEFGLYFYNKHVLTWGSREAARWGVVIAADRRPLGDIQNEAIDYYTKHVLPGAAAASVNVTATRTGADCPDSTAGNPCLLEVRATWNYDPLFLSFLQLDLPDLVARTKMYME
jgi:Flp pilus assembly protein TadG